MKLYHVLGDVDCPNIVSDTQEKAVNHIIDVYYPGYEIKRIDTKGLLLDKIDKIEDIFDDNYTYEITAIYINISNVEIV